MRVTVHIPGPVGEEVEKAAQEEGVSVSALFARAVEKYLGERRRQSAIQRIGAWIGSAHVAPNALEELERDRERSDRSTA